MRDRPTHTLDWEHIWPNRRKGEVRLLLRFENDEAVLVDVVGLTGDTDVVPGVSGETEYPLDPAAIADVRQSFEDNAAMDYPFAEEAKPILPTGPPSGTIEALNHVMERWREGAANITAANITAAYDAAGVEDRYDVVPSPDTVMFFGNGNTAVFDATGTHLPEMQESWLVLFIGFLLSKGVQPWKIERVKFTMPDGRLAVPFRTENGWNWRFDPQQEGL